MAAVSRCLFYFRRPRLKSWRTSFGKTAGRRSWTSLVPIQPGGSKPPFFCVHGGGGNVLIYRELARHLGTDYPFYGLQAQGLDGSNDYLTTTEAMADSYLREIRELQPEGPYYLGGFCMGGQVAVEIAQRLVRDGQQVNLLFVIDTHNFNGVPPQFTSERKSREPGTENQVSFLERLATEPQKPDRLPYRKIEDCPAQGNGTMRIKIVHLFKLNPHRDVVMGTQEEFIEDINDRAFLAYKPSVLSGQNDDLQAAKKLFILARSVQWLGRNRRRRFGDHRVALRPGRHLPRTLRANPGARSSRSKSIRPRPSRRSSRSAGSSSEVRVRLGIERNWQKKARKKIS